MLDIDAENYRRFLDGDRDAIAEIVKKYGDRLVLFLDGYVRNLEEAEDLMEDVFVDLMVRRPKFRGESKFSTYLFAACRNRALSALRRRKREPETLDEQAEGGVRTEDAVFQEERRRALYAALGELREDSRAAVYLVYFEQKSYAETAKILKKSEKQVDNLLSRARARLRTELKDWK